MNLFSLQDIYHLKDFFCWLVHTKLTIQETVYVHLCVFLCVLKYVHMQSLAFYEVIAVQVLILYVYTCIFHHLQHAWRSFSTSVYSSTHCIRLLWISPHSKILPTMFIISRTQMYIGGPYHVNIVDGGPNICIYYLEEKFIFWKCSRANHVLMMHCACIHIQKLFLVDINY